MEEIIFDFQDVVAMNQLNPVDNLFCCLGKTIRTAGSKEAFRFVDFKLPFRFAKWAEKINAKY